MAGAVALLVQQVPRGLDRELYDATCAIVIFPLFAYLATAVEPGHEGPSCSPWEAGRPTPSI